MSNATSCAVRSHRSSARRATASVTAVSRAVSTAAVPADGHGGLQGGQHAPSQPAASRSIRATVRAPSAPARSRSNAASMPVELVTCVTTSATGKPPGEHELGHRARSGRRRRRSRSSCRGCPSPRAARAPAGRRRRPAGVMPTTIAVAPGRSTSQASRIVAGEPTASKAWSTPPRRQGEHRGGGVRARARPRASRRGPARASSLAASRSTAMIRPAPASRPPPRAAARRRRSRPRTRSPPRPTRAALRTAPTAVTTPQPSSAACHSGSARRHRHGRPRRARRSAPRSRRGS